MRQLLVLILCLITWASSETTAPSNLTEELSSHTETESNQNSVNTVKISSRSLGWSSWSEWSTCSRSCDGGVTHQLRRCNSAAGCKGEPVRHKICNMQPCPESREFREVQCASYDDVPYEGALFKWTPHYDDTEPCSLTCRGRPSALDNLISQEGLQAEEEGLIVVARLADRVHDGTRCRPGSLDMCIEGKCKRVGCDLRIGSTKKVDACGVCGGDGSSCAQPLYHWNITPMSLCSVTCGGGYKMSRPVCQNRVTGTEVEEQLCNASQKPEATVVHCNIHKCPPRWLTGEWGGCSVSCGGGTRMRQVQCVEEANSTKTKVNEHNCRGHKPRYQEPCNEMDCPKWHTSVWSGCSVSCGEGLQVRDIECRDSQDLPSALCEPFAKPSPTQACSTGIACPEEEPDHLDELIPGLYHTHPLVQPYPPIPAKAEKLTAEQIVPSESTFIADDWGPCSVTCGEGFRKREVHCKIFLEFSRTIAKLPDKQCAGPKPIDTEKCVMDPCSMANRIDTVRDGYMDGSYPDPFRPAGYDLSTSHVSAVSSGRTYSWKAQGYTKCSASCLGGTQELVVHCVRDGDQRITADHMCNPDTKPETIIKQCNEHPCPPRWNYSEFQPCTQSCGMGHRTREVHCIREDIPGGSAVIVPHKMCTQPSPPERQMCNVLDCPAKWQMTNWTKCSATCGGGFKERKVECQQAMAQNHIVSRPAHMCPTSKPQERKPCNTRPCIFDSDRPEIVVSNSTFIQHDAKRERVSVQIGGSATVFYGTLIKIKCHVKRFNRTRILWAKDRKQLTKSKKFKISKKGALRIHNLTYRDSGVYTCLAGKSSADLSLTVKPKPGEFPSSEEIERQNANRINRNRLDDTPDRSGSRSDEHHKPFMVNEDHSHEQRPGEGPQPLPKKDSGRNRGSFRPTMPPILSHGDGGNSNRLDLLGPHLTTSHGTDQEQDGVLPSHLPASAGSLRPPLQAEVPSSSASRPMPHFQLLLAKLQTFGNSRGHRMVDFPMDDIPTTTQDMFTGNEYDTSEDDLLGPAVVLGKGTADNLKFDWMITDWSKCSQSCGGNGFQMRAAHCMVRLHNTTQDVDAILCEDAGLATPPTIRKCGTEECPRWIAGEWSPCEESRCFTWNTAMQKRDVICKISNTSDVPSALCNENDKPPNRKECYNEKCKGTWRVGEWSECAAACEAKGVKYRILQCVWYGTKKAAGNACREQPRPAVMKSCRGPPCPKVNECMDHSKFCPNVKAMNMCRVQRYQQQCCRSCRTTG